MTAFNFFEAAELPVPAVTPDQARAIAAEHFRLDARITALGSQQDANFLLSHPAGDPIGVLKIANSAFSRLELEAQDAAAAFIAAGEGIRTAANLELPGAARIAELDTGGTGSALLARVISYLPGGTLSGDGYLRPAQVAALGDLGTLQIRALRQRTDRDPCIGAFVVGDYGAQPWESASDGEKVLADAYFRDAIARCRKATALPLIIARANLYAPKDGGALPRFTGPVWVLRSERTDDAGSIVVT